MHGRCCCCSSPGHDCSNCILAGTAAAPQAQLDPPLEAQAALEDEEAAQSGEAAIHAVLTGAIAKVVYRTAIEAVPDSISFRQGFLRILSQFKFEGVSSLREAILDSIQQDFGDTEEAWDLKARAASNEQASTSQASCQPLPDRATRPSHAVLCVCTTPVLLCCFFMQISVSSPALSMPNNSNLAPS